MRHDLPVSEMQVIRQLHEEHLNRTRALFAQPGLASITPGQRRALLGLRIAFLAFAFGATAALFGRSLYLIA